jgi:hypothetical protein
MHAHPKPALAALATAVAAAFFAAAPAHAGEQQGVKCPDGFEAHISNDNRKLVCSRRYTLQSVCSPAVFAASGLKFNGNIVMDPVGRDGGIDQCMAVGAGRKVDSVMSPPLPGYPALATFERKKHPTGPDKFESSTIEYAFPVGGRTYVGDASKGVQCPAGYDGDQRFNGRGIRCDKLDGPPKTADCDGLNAGIVSIGWELKIDRRGNEDRCVPTGGGSDGPTKPEGMTKVHHDAERALDNVGWVLKDRDGRDRWQRKVYVWPKGDFPL